MSTTLSTSESYFIKSGSTFHISNKRSVDIREQLPVGTYVVCFNNMTNEYYLDTITFS